MRFLTPIILVVAAIGLFFGFTDTRYKALEEKQQTLATIQAAIDSSRAVAQKRDDLHAAYVAIDTKDLDKLKKLLPDGVDNVRLILDMDNIASRHGITLRNVRVDNSSATAAPVGSGATGYGSINISFSVAASFTDFQSFVRDLEQSLRLVDIVSLSVRGSSNGIYDYSLTLNTYWLR